MTDRLRIAVFIDFDNIEIGVKNTLNASFDAGLVLEALKERGEVVSKMAYSDWQRAGGYSRALTQHAIRMVQRNLTPGGDKNGADINLALDALEMAFTHPHINAFVIVGGDSDFISLVEKLKQYDKKVFVVGGQQFTSVIMQRNCHEFIAYENLIGAGRRGGSARGPRADRADITQVVPLVKRALKVMLERDVDPQLGLFKSTLLQLDSTFNERTFGAGTFRDFAQKLEKAGVLRVHQGKGGWLVAPAEGVSLDVAPGDGESASPAEVTPARSEAPAPSHRQSSPRQSQAQSQSQAAPAASAAATPSAPVEILGGAADGVSELFRIVSASEIRKWPLYLRQVKQIVRAQTPPFDERAYGSASLVDLLRASHKEGAFRVERDRQGVIRVFQSGSAGLAAAGGGASDPRGSEHSEAEAPVLRTDAPEDTGAEAPVDAPMLGTHDASAPAKKRPARKRAVKSAGAAKPKAAKAAKAPKAAKKAKS
ncbi:MAG: NYN domain-containing protein [Acidobacteria bacterium]|nr:NYN domain-containing protein [Acidobacteriota bacterium]